MRRCALFAVLCLLASSFAVPAAFAAPSLEPPVEGRSLLAFGVSYWGRVHEGLDLAAASGATVRAPGPGTVTFAGKLPSGTGLAVTVTTDDGLKVTCSPLASVSVAKGATLAKGETIGALAGEGDPSSPEAHVHLSVRRGDTYLDPDPLIAWPAAPEADPQGAADAPAPAPSPASAPVPAVAEAGRAAGQASAAEAPQAATHTEVPSAASGEVSASGARLSLSAAEQLPRASAAAVSALAARGARAFRAQRSLARARRAAVPESGALASAQSAIRTARLGVTALAAGLVALAMLWPVWRRANALEPAAEPAVVEVRS